jgi:WD40 repeat protein
MSEAAHPVLPPEEVTPRFDTVAGTENLTVTSLGCARTPEGRILLATASFGAFVVQLWDLESGRHLRTLTGHDDAMLDVAWGRADDGRLLLATASFDDTARIWDPATGQQLQILTGHDESVAAVAWGHATDGRLLLATASDDRTVRIWDPANGQQLQILTGHDHIVSAVEWGTRPDGRLLLATGSYDGTVRIWDPANGQQLRTLTAGGEDEIVLAVGWGARSDGTPLLATGSYDGTVRIWDPANGRQLRTLIAGEVAGDDREQTHVLAWAWAAAGRPLLATAGIAGIEAGTARIWDPATGTELACLPGTGSGWRSAVWIRDRAGNLLLLLANPDDAAVPVRVWRVESGGSGAAEPQE